MNAPATSVVIATRNRASRLLDTLHRLRTLPGVAEIIVADNASNDGTSAAVRSNFRDVRLITLAQNEGAFARTIAARNVRTRYIAFCDDDTWWMPGSIEAGARVLDRHDDIALVNARIMVEPHDRLDEACAAMARGLGTDDLPGAPILFFMAGAALARTDAFLSCGGYERRLFIGGEETLLALELQRRGWSMRYLPELEIRHAPCGIARDDAARRRLLLRNRLWVAWMRYSRESAWRATLDAARRARRDHHARAALLRALAGLPWAISRRSPVDEQLQRRIDAIWTFDAR